MIYWLTRALTGEQARFPHLTPLHMAADSIESGHMALKNPESWFDIRPDGKTLHMALHSM